MDLDAQLPEALPQARCKLPFQGEIQKRKGWALYISPQWQSYKIGWKPYIILPNGKALGLITPWKGSIYNKVNSNTLDLNRLKAFYIPTPTAKPWECTQQKSRPERAAYTAKLGI